MPYFWNLHNNSSGELVESSKKFQSEVEARRAAHKWITESGQHTGWSIKITTEPYPYSRDTR